MGGMRLRRARRPMTLFESRTEQWREVGLGSEIDRGRAQRARGGVVVICVLIAGVLFLFSNHSRNSRCRSRSMTLTSRLRTPTSAA